MKSEIETEVKIRVADAGEIRELLGRSGFRESVPRVFEANTLYDTPERSLRARRMLLRLREAGEQRVITWKGRGETGPHKARPELETAIGSLETFSKILEQLGYVVTFRYEKFRTEFMEMGHEEDGTVTLDETPIGNFLELEGPGKWIDATAKRLGFTTKDYVLESYGGLYLADCEKRGVQPTNMIFPSKSTGKV